MSEGKAPFLDTGAVAAILRMHPNTVRDHLVPIADWYDGCPSIPYLKLGGRYLIPRWWVEHIKKAGNEPPADRDEEVEAVVRKSPRS